MVLSRTRYPTSREVTEMELPGSLGEIENIENIENWGELRSVISPRKEVESLRPQSREIRSVEPILSSSELKSLSREERARYRTASPSYSLSTERFWKPEESLATYERLRSPVETVYSPSRSVSENRYASAPLSRSPIKSVTPIFSESSLSASPVSRAFSQSSSWSSREHRPESDYNPNVPASEAEKKYCSCIRKVSAKQSDQCLANKEFGSGHCYNPYAVCAKSTGTTSRRCSEILPYSSLSPQERHAEDVILASKHSTPVSSQRM
ncbi:MAG: hypothetical protein ACYCQJ_12375 [Nitrososphaerales archaeon]